MGIDSSDCMDKYNGDSCTAKCVGSYEGDPEDYFCKQGVLQSIADEIQCQKIKCTNGKGLPTGPYNMSECTDLDEGQSCIISCTPGNIPTLGFFMCQADGSYSGQVEDCLPLPCWLETLRTGVGVNGTDCEGKVAGETCLATCALGYEGVGKNISCDIHGVFNGAAPTCSVQRCDIPGSINVISVFHTCEKGGVRVAWDEDCSAGCAKGYDGSLVDLDCTFNQSSLQLMGSMPQCTAKECTRNTPAGLGMNTATCTGKRTAESCSLSCKRGFTAPVADQHSSITCKVDGAFTNSSFTCARMHCSNLATVPNFSSAALYTAACSSLVFGQSCSLSCAPGYVPAAGGAVAQPLQCQAAQDTMAVGGYVLPQSHASADSQLAVLNLTCEALNCTMMLPDRYGVIHNCTGLKTGQSCVASHHPAFSYMNNNKAEIFVCGPDGAFSGTLPEVKPLPCPTISFSTGVANTCENKTLGTSCWTYCDSGFEGSPAQYACNMTKDLALEPSVKAKTTTCTSTRRLQVSLSTDRRLSTCDASAAGMGLTAANISHNCLGKADGSTCIVECAVGYTITGDAVVWTCQSGSFSGSGLPACTPNKCTMGFPSGVGVTHGCIGAVTAGTCTAQCGAGYTGTSTNFTCQNTGELSGTRPACTATACTALSLDPSRRAAACAGKTTGQTCVVDCADGYDLVGGAKLYTCQTNGSLTGWPPTCQARQCTEGVPTGSDLKVGVTCNALKTAETCAVSCADGYSGSASTFTCSALGDLQGTKPTCSPQTCANSIAATGGLENTCDGTSYGAKCLVSCSSGYRMKAGTVAQEFNCSLVNGAVSLVGALPKCEPVRCEYNLPTGSIYSHTCKGIGTDQNCSWGCAAGYFGSAESFVCRSDKALAGTKPTCTLATCPARPVAFVQDSCSSTTFGSQCFASCAPGFNGTMKSWMCGWPSSGLLTLQGDVPQCTRKPCLYKFPNGPQYLHTCQGTETSGQCTVGCADGWQGFATTLTCLSDQSLSGTLPVCIRTTATVTTTTATTTTTTTALPRARIRGSLTMSVSDPVKFARDPDVLASITEAIADLAEVPLSYVEVKMKVVVRRLQAATLESLRRRLAGAVIASYTISLPADQPATVTGTAASIQGLLANCTAGIFTDMIMLKLGSGVYTFTVQSVTAPVIEVPGATAPAAATTTHPGFLSGLEGQASQAAAHIGLWVCVSVLVCCLGFFCTLFCRCMVEMKYDAKPPPLAPRAPQRVVPLMPSEEDFDATPVIPVEQLRLQVNQRLQVQHVQVQPPQPPRPPQHAWNGAAQELQEVIDGAQTSPRGGDVGVDVHASRDSFKSIEDRDAQVDRTEEGVTPPRVEAWATSGSAASGNFVPHRLPFINSLAASTPLAASVGGPSPPVPPVSPMNARRAEPEQSLPALPGTPAFLESCVVSFS